MEDLFDLRKSYRNSFKTRYGKTLKQKPMKYNKHHPDTGSLPMRLEISSQIPSTFTLRRTTKFNNTHFNIWPLSDTHTCKFNRAVRKRFLDRDLFVIY